MRLLALALAALLLAGAARADMIFDPESGCATSNPFPRPGESVRWSGGCRDGLLDGPGTLIWLDDGVEYERDEGVFRAGELHGEALITFAAGGRIQGRYRNGARDGEFVVERPDGTIVRATYEKGLFISEQPMSADEAAAWRAGRPLAISSPAIAAAPPIAAPPVAAPPPAQIAPAPIPPAPAATASPAYQPLPVLQPPPDFRPPPPSDLRLRLAPPPSGKLGAVPLATRTVALVPPAPFRSPPPAPQGQSTAPPAQSTAPPAHASAPPPRLRAPLAPASGPVPTPVTAAPEPSAPTAPSRPAAASGRYAVSLQDASIRDAAETVLGGILNRRYVVEPGVAGAVSIAAENFVDSAALLSAFRRELLRNGADLVDQSGVLRIVATRVTAAPAAASAVGRRVCTRPELYDGGARWCGVVRGETAEAYDLEVVSVAPNAAFASGLAASPCTGGVFLSRFERGKRIAAPKGCLDFEG